jgi:hypothetical protein
MEKCQRCGGTKKLYRINAKCSDLYSQDHIGGNSYEGYVPDWIGPDGYGDYVSFTVCRHCGQIQGEWPELDATLNRFKSGRAV